MPTFYFDLIDGDAIAVDEVGMQLSGLEAAVDVAARVLNDLTKQAEEAPQKSYLCEMIIQVRDGKGNLTEVTQSAPTRH